MSREVLLSARGITKTFVSPSGRLDILKGIDLEVASGDSVSIVGASGAGKSTLLHILGTLDRPTLGRLSYRGLDLTLKADHDLARHRNQKMGFVFQFHHLIFELTAVENVAVPLRLAGRDKKEAEKKAQSVLEQMGLGQRLKHRPNQLSGGEQQRVAIARALVNDPEILFADEPTGNLDTANAAMIQDLLFQIVAQRGLALLVVTHDLSFAGRFARSLRMRDGQWEK